jgi:hypothetical protein
MQRGAMKLDPENEEQFDDDDYSEAEIGRFTDSEYELENLRYKAFLDEEREEQESFEREFAEELDQLLATIRDKRTDSDADPPGWPDF